MKGFNNKIIELLKNDGIKTSKEISSKIQISEDPKKNLQFIRTYLLRLQNKGIIEVKKKDGKENYYGIIEGIESYKKLVELYKGSLDHVWKERANLAKRYSSLLDSYRKLEEILKSVIKPEVLKEKGFRMLQDPPDVHLIELINKNK